MSLEDVVMKEVGKVRKVVVTGDYHIPYLDGKAFSLMLRYVKENKPNVFVINGDLLDFYSLSNFDKNPEHYSIDEELKQGKDAIRKIRRAVGKKTKIYYLEGNHECVTEDTEVLTDKGWKLAAEITKQDKVAQFNMRSGRVRFDYPLKVSSRIVDKWVVVKTWLGEEHVTFNHALIINGRRVKVSDAMKKGFSQTEQRFAGFYETANPLPLSNEEIKLLTWVIADGTVVDYSKYNPNSSKVGVQFKLSKQRKIRSLTNLLDSMGVPYTLRKATVSRHNKLQPFMIRIYGYWAKRIFNLLGGVKRFPEEWVLNISEEQLKALLKTLAETDGGRAYNHIVWTSTDFENVDRVQRMCILHGIPAKYSVRDNRAGFGNKPVYKVSIYPEGIVSKYASFEVVPEIKKFVAITTKEETLITRVNGRVNFTGNSRLQKYLWKNKELYGLEGLKLENLLMLNVEGVKWVGADPDYWKKTAGTLKLGDTIIMHGDKRLNGGSLSKYAGYSAKNTMYSVMSNLVMGHSHRLAQIHYSANGKDLVGVEGGCLCEVPPTVNWQQGFVTLTYSNGKLVDVKLNRIVKIGGEYRLYDGGRVYKTKK